MHCPWRALCLQINRNSLFSFFLESSSRLTPHMLKGRTGEFDLESISFLDLSGMGRNKVLIFHNYWMWIFKIHKLKCTVQILVLAISALFSTSQIDNNFPWSILLDHSNDIKMFQTQVKPRATGKWFHCKVFNILTSFLWAIGVQTLENSCWIVFYNTIESFGAHFCWNVLENPVLEKGKNKLCCYYHIISLVCILIEHNSWPISMQEITQLW